MGGGSEKRLLHLHRSVRPTDTVGVFQALDMPIKLCNVTVECSAGYLGPNPRLVLVLETVFICSTTPLKLISSKCLRNFF